MTPDRLLRSIRIWLGIFIVGLVLSGLTAFPLETELRAAVRLATSLHLDSRSPDVFAWLGRVHLALTTTNSRFPFLAYGTDWLAFAHLVIAVAFIGPWRDPLQNEWVVTFGIIACLGVFGLALVAGPIRGIPLFWRLIDCSFGVLGLIPLLVVRSRITVLHTLPTRRQIP